MTPGCVRVGRRQFLRGSLALAGVGLLAGCGQPVFPWQQPAKMPRIGYLVLIRSGDPARVRYMEGFRQGLREHGWVEGQNFELDFRSAEGQPDRLPALAAELARREPEVVLAAGGSLTLRAFRDVTSTIPIVFPAYSGDPVADGYVASLARPGGNVTGFIGNAPELNGKRLELLKAIVPGLSRVAVLWNAASAAAAIDWRETQAAAQVLGLRLLGLPVRTPDDFERAFEAAMEEPPDALNTLPDPITLTHRARIIDFAAQRRLPAMYGQREIASDGGLVSYGVNITDLFRRAATHVDKILNGTKPADLPVERPTAFDSVMNIKTARALGLTIPQSVLVQATEVIE